MTRPFLLVQISDPHIGATWGIGDPVELLSRTVAAIDASVPAPDAVLVSGDLADHGSDAEYGQVRELLAPLGAPVYVVAGNHDDRGLLRRHFGIDGYGDEPLQYAVELGPLRLVVLDSARPGVDPGALDAGRLAWLEAALAAAPGTPTLVALHHAPLLTGVPAYDEANLPREDRLALEEVVARHPQVRRIVAGHTHRTIVGELAGRPVLVMPSTYVQARLELANGAVELGDDPSGFVVHTFADGELVSHLQPVAR